MFRFCKSSKYQFPPLPIFTTVLTRFVLLPNPCINPKKSGMDQLGSKPILKHSGRRRMIPTEHQSRQLGSSWAVQVLNHVPLQLHCTKLLCFVIHLLPNSRSNQNKNQIKPKIWRGSIIAGFLSFFLSLSLACFLVRHAQNSSDVTLAFEDAD